MVTRRRFLAITGAGVVAAATAVEVAGLTPLGLPRSAAETNPPPRGLFGGTTTLDRTVTKDAPQPVTGYVKLIDGLGEGHMRRADLYPEVYRHPTLSLAAFVQITDMQIVDDKSPARVEFTDRLANIPNAQKYDTAAAYRPHEFLSTHLVEAMARAIRNLKFGPKTGLPLAFTIATGDMVDNVQFNETRWYIDLLDGNHAIRQDSGQFGLEQSISGNFGALGATGKHDLAYWYPEANKPPGVPFADDYKTTYGFPVVPGLLAAARKPYTSTGLGMPWYAAMGNHDGEIQGNYPVHPPTVEGVIISDISNRATGPNKGIGAGVPLKPKPDPFDIDRFVRSVLTAPVVADPNRRFLTRTDFIHEHFNTTGLPDGHGFSFNGPGYYKIPSADSDLIQYITLDTVNYDGNANGRINGDQFKWLEARLKANSSMYFGYDDVTDQHVPNFQPGVKDKLFVIFCHHTIASINNKSTNLVDIGEPDFYYGDALKGLLLRHPNVILMVNGHTHRNHITAHRREELGPFMPGFPPTGGFWEIQTAAHIDWPSQSRVIEIAAGGDAGAGTAISIFTTIVDIDAPVDHNGDLSTPVALASLARELAANDPTERSGTGSGDPADRNAQLLLPAPFPLPVGPDWGSSVALARNQNGKLLMAGTNPSDDIYTQAETAAGAQAWAGWGLRQGKLRTVVTETNSDGRVELIGVNSDGVICRQAQPSPNAQFLDNWTVITASPMRSLALASNPDGRLQLMGINTNHLLQVAAQTSPGASTWSAWENRGSDLVKVAAQTSSAGIEVFGLYRDGQVLHLLKSASTGAWGDWHGFEEGRRFGSIAVARNLNGKIVFFGIDHDWRVWSRTQNTAGSPSAWGPWQDLDGRMTQIAADTNTNGLVALVGVDNAGAIWYRQELAGAAGWSAWSAVQGGLRPDVPAPASTAVATPPPPPVNVPNVISLDEPVAVSVISSVGLVPNVTYQKSNLDKQVLVQNPSQGQTVAEGTTVHLTVGKKSKADPPA